MDWEEESLGLAAQCWCDPETQHLTLDPALCSAVAKRIAAWMETAAQNQRNTEYYRGLVQQCGKSIGKTAYIQDDGGVVDSVLCAKVPELVEELMALHVQALKDQMTGEEAPDGN